MAQKPKPLRDFVARDKAGKNNYYLVLGSREEPKLEDGMWDVGWRADSTFLSKANFERRSKIRLRPAEGPVEVEVRILPKAKKAPSRVDKRRRKA